MNVNMQNELVDPLTHRPIAALFKLHGVLRTIGPPSRFGEDLAFAINVSRGSSVTEFDAAEVATFPELALTSSQLPP